MLQECEGGSTPLLHALGKGDIPIVRMLLADPRVEVDLFVVRHVDRGFFRSAEACYLLCLCFGRYCRTGKTKTGVRSIMQRLVTVAWPSPSSSLTPAPP